MVKLDSIKLKIPIDSGIKVLDRKKCEIKKYSIDGELQTIKYIIPDSCIGLKSMQVCRSSDAFIMEASAKILSDNYLQGININTLQQFIDTVEKITGIRITNEALEHSELLKVDFTENPEFDMKFWNELKTALHLSCLHQNYQINNYTKGANNGLVIAGIFSSKKDRLIIYSKGNELERDNKANRTFAKQCSNFEALKKQAMNKARVEVNSVSKKQTVNLCKTINNKLLPILQSTEKPAYNTMQRLSKNNLEVSSAMGLLNSKQSLRDIERETGIRNIIARLQYSEEMIISFLKFKLGLKNWHRTWNGYENRKGYKYYLIEAKKNQIQPKEDISIVMDSFMQALKAVS